MVSHRPFCWWFLSSLRSSCPQTLPKVQWRFQMWNMVGLVVILAQEFKSLFVLSRFVLVFFAVIDFCLTRRMVCDQETSLQFLSLTWASKTNCNQRRGTMEHQTLNAVGCFPFCRFTSCGRENVGSLELLGISHLFPLANSCLVALVFIWASHFISLCQDLFNAFLNVPGRAGRVSKGYCYRLVTKQFWDVDIPDHMVPDMQVSVGPPLDPIHTVQLPTTNTTTQTLFHSSFSELAPLSTIVLKVKLLDIGDPRTVLSTALSPPNITGIVSTVLQLKEVLHYSLHSHTSVTRDVSKRKRRFRYCKLFNECKNISIANTKSYSEKVEDACMQDSTTCCRCLPLSDGGAVWKKRRQQGELGGRRADLSGPRAGSLTHQPPPGQDGRPGLRLRLSGRLPHHRSVRRHATPIVHACSVCTNADLASLLHPSAASHSQKSFFAVPSMQHLASYRWVTDSNSQAVWPC